MRSHDRTGQGDGKSGSDAIAGDSAHWAAETGVWSSGIVEPSGCRNVAGVVAGAFARMEPFLSRHRGSADRVRSGGRSRENPAGTGGGAGFGSAAGGH